MYLVLKANSTWRPEADFKQLKQRSTIIQTIREFFNVRNLLEVDTPLLHYASVTTPHITSLTTTVNKKNKLYLQTSPEFAMKRLLAAGSGPIFQICKAFRDDMKGQHHNPEFTLLEWYQPGYDHHKLINEVNALLKNIMPGLPSKKISYLELFQDYCNINPHTISLNDLKNKTMEIVPTLSNELKDNNDKDTWLDIIMTQHIEAKLKNEGAVFIYNYPKTQASLARIIKENETEVAARFELYIYGIELANGFYELQDPEEQYRRFIQENKKRKEMDLTEIKIDNTLIRALEHGLPDCSGVALGIDRLIMVASNKKHINQVMSFVTEYEHE